MLDDFSYFEESCAVVGCWSRRHVQYGNYRSLTIRSSLRYEFPRTHVRILELSSSLSVYACVTLCRPFIISRYSFGWCRWDCCLISIYPRLSFLSNYLPDAHLACSRSLSPFILSNSSTPPTLLSITQRSATPLLSPALCSGTCAPGSSRTHTRYVHSSYPLSFLLCSCCSCSTLRTTVLRVFLEFFFPRPCTVPL